MKHPFSGRLLPWFSLGMGGLTLALRSWLYQSGIDAKGLFLSAHPAGIFAFVITAVFLAGLLLWVLPMKRCPAYRMLYPQSPVAAIGCVVSGIGVWLSALHLLLTRDNPIMLVTGILGIPAAVCIIFCGWCRWKGLRPSYFFHGIVTVFLLLYCVCQYRIWSTEPQFAIYFFPLLTCVLLMVYAYQRTAVDAGSGNLQMLTFAGQAATFFCLASIPDGNWVFFLSMAVWCATGTASYPQSLGGDGDAAT